MFTSTTLCLLLSVTLAIGAEKQIKLEDIERDNLSSKKGPQQPTQQQAKPEEPPSAPSYTEQGNDDVQQPGQHQLNYQNQQQQQVLLQHLQGFQPQLQYQTPPTAGAVALYPATFLAGTGIGGNHLGLSGIPHDVGGLQAIPAYITTPQHQGVPTAPTGPAFPQHIYLPGGYTGLQFVQAPHSALIYANQQAPPEDKVAPPTAQSQQANPEKELLESSPADSNPQKPPVLPTTAKSPQPNFQQQKGPVPPQTPSADSNIAYTPQQNFNPIPKELQSYTTIPDSVYQGKEPEYVYDQPPTISLTNDQFTPYNTLYQHPQPQRPIFSAGIKSPGPSSLKSFPSGSFFRNSFLSPTRHFPGPGISYSSYRQGPSAF